MIVTALLSKIFSVVVVEFLHLMSLYNLYTGTYKRDRLTTRGCDRSLLNGCFV